MEDVKEKKNSQKMPKPLRITLITIGSVILGLLIFVIGFVGYVLLSYNRIGDQDLEIDHHATLNQIEVGETYKAVTYNIGFGAYSQDYTFFLDTGYDEEGNPTSGYYSKAKSKEEVEFNINGAISTIAGLDADFIFFQEVDTNSTRSYHINQDEMIQKAFNNYDHIHCMNFHTAFLPYPLYDMHGKVRSGLTTLSKYKGMDAKRYEYTVSDGFSKFFDLDRCFSVMVIDVSNGKKLYIVNSHMSAYDEGGTIRSKQIEEINSFLQERKNNGDYVIIGGDWNHDLLTYNPDYSYTDSVKPFSETKKDPDWLNRFFNNDGQGLIIDGYKVIASDNHPTCRNNDIEYEPGKTYTCVADGFIVSNNIEIVLHQNIETSSGNKGYDGFAYSDHDPAYIEFKLN